MYVLPFRSRSYGILPQCEYLAEAPDAHLLQALLSDPRGRSSDHTPLCPSGGLRASEWPILLLLRSKRSQWHGSRWWAGQKAVGSERDDVWPVMRERGKKKRSGEEMVLNFLWKTCPSDLPNDRWVLRCQGSDIVWSCTVHYIDTGRSKEAITLTALVIFHFIVWNIWSLAYFFFSFHKHDKKNVITL